MDNVTFFDRTLVRPVLQKYSITRYSDSDWSRHNNRLLNTSDDIIRRSNQAENSALQSIDYAYSTTDRNQENNTKLLKIREKHIYKFREELLDLSGPITEESELLEIEKNRVKKSLMILLIPNSITSECLEKRSYRLDNELVNDKVEIELRIELNLIARIRSYFEDTLKEIINQLRENKAAKISLELDWSDKIEAYDITNTNSLLNNKSDSKLFKPGSTIFCKEQSVVESWQAHVTKISEDVRRTIKSAENLRFKTNAILLNSSRDLITQSENINLLLTKQIAKTEEARQEMEMELKKILQRLLDIENLMPKVKHSIRRLDAPMKVAQTRLDNYKYRARIENCRDPPEYGIIVEVKEITSEISNLQIELKNLESCHNSLLLTRHNLEKEIFLKNNALDIDKNILLNVRSAYPTTIALSGYYT